MGVLGNSPAVRGESAIGGKGCKMHWKLFRDIGKHMKDEETVPFQLVRHSHVWFNGMTEWLKRDPIIGQKSWQTRRADLGVQSQDGRWRRPTSLTICWG